MFRKMPVILLGIIVLIIFGNDFIPTSYKSILYATSLTIKSGIIFLLPFVIFMLLFKTLSQIAGKATKIIFFVLFAVCLSNFIGTMISYGVGTNLDHFNLALSLPKDSSSLDPAWSFSLPKLVANDHAMFAGIILGILFGFFNVSITKNISQIFEKVVDKILKLIVCVMPLFIAGFMVKLVHEKVIENIFQDYAIIFALIAFALLTYINLIYFLASKGQFSEYLKYIKNMLPAGITGFGTMSSAATMPLTIIGAEKNSNNPTLTRLVIPTTVNIHLMGDCFAIPIFALAILNNYSFPEPSFLAYLIFAIYFVIAKFSVAGIPGGGILVMLPILESHLGFNAEMSSLITALYILFDPVITCANVMGNGAFSLVISKLSNFTYKKPLTPIKADEALELS